MAPARGETMEEYWGRIQQRVTKHPLVVEEEARIGKPLPKMCGHRFLLKMLDNDGQTRGGIILPQNMKDIRTRRGVVIAKGPGEYVATSQPGNPRFISAGAEVGDIAIIGYWGGYDFEISGFKYLSVKGDDIMAYEPAPSG